MGTTIDESTTPTQLLLPTTTATTKPPPKDKYHLSYLIHFTLGAGYLLPWNAFITAVDYFSYLYPSYSVDRVFSVAYMLTGLLSLLVIIFYPKKSGAHFRINLGLGMFVVCLVVVPGLELVGLGEESGFGVTVAAVCLAGVADALVQGSLIGSAGELPDRYMQAVVAGTAASGVLVSFLRIFTKAVYPQDAHGLRNSAILYFIVGIVLMVVCLVFHNVAHRLPVMKYYNDLKVQAINDGKQEKGSLSGPIWKLMGEIKWYGAGIVIIYVVTLSIFPGFITEDVHSTVLRDWYPILLITSYNVFDLVGKSFTSIYLFENANASIIACFVRLLFYPLYLGCLHGPLFFRTEIPVVLLTCLLGLTNGYFTSVLFILAPKTVQVQHAETTATLMVLFLILGLASGSIVSWFWVI
ncbi:equilibrative nucleotide transporter 1-like [Silene latifolia]|uniref:equilibrative nucleotide transporter 1-like n=1 Tax=Silene latifolia TaxID=37657 RepID=UPI003D78A7FD